MVTFGILLLDYLPSSFRYAVADPIQSISPRTQFFLGTAGRSFSRLVNKERGDRDLDVLAIPAIGSYNLKTDATLSLVVPYISKRLKMRNKQGRRIILDADGIGDMELMGKYRFYRKDVPFGSTLAALIGGLKLPTGSDDEGDEGRRLPPPLQPGSGSVDFKVGLALGKITQHFALEGGILYDLNTEANDFRFGNVLRYDLSFQYQLFPTWPTPYTSQLNLTLELNGESVQKDRQGRNTLGNSGGTTILISPGLQYILTDRFLLEMSLQLPIVQNLNTNVRDGLDPLKTDFSVLFGFRFIF